MENTKYYTPEIEEFCVGLEVEVNQIDSNWKSYGWEKEKVEKDFNFKLAFEYIGLYRIKYLDKQDIESFGFVEDKSNSDQYRLNLELVKDDYIYGVVLYDTTQICIYKYKHKEDIIFHGKIKNKTEFKKLLIQLGINGNN